MMEGGMVLSQTLCSNLILASVSFLSVSLVDMPSVAATTAYITVIYECMQSSGLCVCVCIVEREIKNYGTDDIHFQSEVLTYFI